MDIVMELNKIHKQNCIDFMKSLPENAVDLAFADPPYNLSKDYSEYDDDISKKEYINWCNDWLYWMYRILKPTGSLYVLNMPQWAVHHAVFLDKYMYRQNWITWDALSKPAGKIMPSNYTILYYTKKNQGYTFNKQYTVKDKDSCFRKSCVNTRNKSFNEYKKEVTDIWSDVHRIKHRKQRDAHPCQLPEELLKRIILTSTNENDIVFDPFMGAGTTAIVASQLNRRFTGTEIDEKYIDIINCKINNENENPQQELFTFIEY